MNAEWEQLTTFLHAVLEPGTVTELRALGVDGFGTRVARFRAERVDDMAGFADCFRRRCKGVYVCLNPLGPALLTEHRAAKDEDVLRRRWLLVDVDPERPGTVSATDAEKEQARAVVERVRADLAGRGWPEPILSDSGNGYHLLYRIDLPAEDGGLIQRVLAELAARFDTPAAKIDTSVHNPSRICRVPGTWACKGEDTPERPFRLARLVNLPAEVRAVSREQVELLAGAAGHDPAGLTPPSRPCVTLPRPSAWPVVPPEHLAEILRRARRYLAKVPPAVQGQGGDKATFAVVCLLQNDYALARGDAWPLLLEWNARCVPPWEEADLARKWAKSEQTGKGMRGAKLPLHIRRSLRPQPAGR